MTTTHKMTFAALAAMAVALSLAVLPAFTTTTYAVPPGLREGCENQGGNEPPGQQGKCQGEGLNTFVENRGGNRPPGQNR
jgi:hypothetical protein